MNLKSFGICPGVSIFFLFYMFALFCRGVCGVMVNTAGSGSSNPSLGSTNTLGKNMNPMILSQAMGKLGSKRRNLNSNKTYRGMGFVQGMNSALMTKPNYKISL